MSGRDLTDRILETDDPAQLAHKLHQLAQDTPPSKPEGDPPEGAYSPNGSRPGMPYQRLPAWQFAMEEEEDADALLGVPDDMLLPAGGTLLMYGKGGAAKTTLTLDAMCHLCAGKPWLGQPTTAPLKIILVENEGPRPLLRRRIRTLIEDWEGDPWHERLEIYTHPWMAFTFRDENCRQWLADWVSDFEADLVMVGPLAAIGAIGGGTPDEVTEFGALLEDTRARTPLAIAFWIVHHENKSGDVSGAWDRVPDTLLHVSGQGNGHTRLHIQKARHSTLHDTSLNLTWTGTYSFAVDDPKPTEEDIKTQVRELFETEDGWRTVEEVRVPLEIGQRRARTTLDALTETGLLTEMVGPPGRNARSRCWRLASGTDVPTLGERVDQFTPVHTQFTQSGQGPGGGGEPGEPHPEGGFTGTGSPNPPATTPPNQPTQEHTVGRTDTPFPDDDFPF